MLLTRLLRLLGSLKLAIPLLVVLTAVTIAGSLLPEPTVFESGWYLFLLGLLGISLLVITIVHIPSIIRRKGRNTLIGVVTTHLGILVLIVGMIYGGFSGFRHDVRLIEGEATVIPGVPFVLRLDKLEVEEYRQEDYPRLDLRNLPKKKQLSSLTLLQGGVVWQQVTAAPGQPAQVDGITLLPVLNELGWYFELVVRDVDGRITVIPVKPWEPPLIMVGGKRLMTHNIVTPDSPQAEFFTLDNDSMVSAGVLRVGEPLEIEGHNISLGSIKRYTAIHIYNRPQEWVLLLGSFLMFVGLVWHFYFRHRDRSEPMDT